jgi:imidazolonepropionase-like amidohydrolase
MSNPNKSLLETLLSAKQGRAGKDVNKPGKALDKHDASQDSVKKTAGSVLPKVKPSMSEGKESFITGTRLISKHEGLNGHEAHIRYNPEYEEYQVHHYVNGVHAGEGPVSYHGSGKDGKEEANSQAKYDTTHPFKTGNVKEQTMTKEDSRWSETNLTKRNVGLEEAISKIGQATFKNKQLYEQEMDRVSSGTDITPAQKSDWLSVEQGRMDFSSYLSKYKV